MSNKSNIVETQLSQTNSTLPVSVVNKMTTSAKLDNSGSALTNTHSMLKTARTMSDHAIIPINVQNALCSNEQSLAVQSELAKSFELIDAARLTHQHPVIQHDPMDESCHSPASPLSTLVQFSQIHPLHHHQISVRVIDSENI